MRVGEGRRSGRREEERGGAEKKGGIHVAEYMWIGRKKLKEGGMHQNGLRTS